MILKHVANEDDADVAIEKFQKYNFEGKELHVERSTSNLRRQPGMSDKCFTCGAEDHKTSQCHKNPNRKRTMFFYVKSITIIVFYSDHINNWNRLLRSRNR
jgi:RNA recognition motif-containing protein